MPASSLKRLVRAKGWPQTYSHERREKLKYGSSLAFPEFRTKGLGQSLISHAGEEGEWHRETRSSILSVNEKFSLFPILLFTELFLHSKVALN